MMRILTLVDDAHIRSVLHAALLPHYDLITSLNTQGHGDAVMLDQPFDMVIVDDAALEREWRHIAARREVEGAVYLPLLFLTPRASVAMTVSHWREHIDDFLVMPFDNVELDARVESLLRTRRISRELNQQPACNDGRAQEALRESEERFRAVFEQAAVGMARVAPDGTWLDVNQKVCDIVGYSKKELLARTFQDITYPADLNMDLAFVRQMLAGELQTYGMDKRYVRKNGALIWIRLTVSLVREPSGVPKYFISVIEDIDQRKSIQSAFYDNERRFSTLVNNLPALVYRCRNDPQWTAEYVSEGVFALTGYKAEDFTINRKISFGELIHPDDRERVWGDVQQGIEARRPYRSTYRVITAQGEHRWMWEQGSGTFDDSGSLLTLDGVVLDVTDRHHAETELRRTEQRLNAAQRIGAIGSWEWDLATDVVTGSSELYRMLGISRADTDPHVFAIIDRVIHPDDRKHVARVAQENRLRGTFSPNEFRLLAADGTVRWVFAQGEAETDEQGNSIRLCGVLQDITQRKESENALRKSQGRLEFALETAHLGAWELDLVDHTAFRSLEHDRIFGYTELLPSWTYEMFLDHVLPDDRAQVDATFKRAIESQGDWSFECRIRRADAQTRVIWAAGRHVREISGVVHRMVGIVQDVTAARRIEAALAKSEGLLRTIVSSEPACVKMVDSDGKVLEMNPAGLAMIEADSREQAIGVEVASIVVPEHREAFIALHRRVMVGESGSLMFDIVGAKGTRRTLETHAAPLRDASGSIIALLGVTHDVTERERAAGALKESAARYQAIFEGAGASLWEEDFSAIHSDVMFLSFQHRAGLRDWFDAHPGEMRALMQRIRVVDVNSATLKLLAAKSKEELLGCIAQIFVPEYLPVFRDKLLVLVGGATSFNAEAEVGTLSNERRTVLLSLTVLPSERPWERILVSLLDISEMKTYRDRLESHVAQRTAQLQTTNKELESFCYSVSHDLRTPLRGIHGFTQVLLEDYGDKFDQTARGYLDRVQQAAIDMGELIDALLGLSRVTRGEIKRVPIDMSSLARQVMETLQLSEPQRCVDTTISPNITAIGDPTLLRAVLENLLGNAWKYTSKTVHARIEFRMEMHAAAPVFCIADNGAGFDMKYATRLFGAFQRLHSGAEFPGTGVGLATVERVVHRHGGRVWAEASVGKGAQFYFTLQP